MTIRKTAGAWSRLESLAKLLIDDPAFGQCAPVHVARDISVMFQIALGGHHDVVGHADSTQSTIDALCRAPPVHAVRHDHKQVDIAVRAQIV
jgi:hypothetical protein